MLLPGIKGAITGSSADIPGRNEAIRAWFAAAAEVAAGAEAGPALLPAALQGQPIADVMVQKLQELRPAIEAQASYIKSTIRDFRDLLTRSAEDKQYFYEAYPFDVRPATDDAPFFFNFYRGRVVR